ncbi:hypothetical protein [Microbacterium gorillae]|uniref:hypothetical protein n=1 Tax=Microbacterium gorillae TaxID=1231063 RepID=UPI00058AED4E|nr:hypothetical protein [Microbacterium gorillae]
MSPAPDARTLLIEAVARRMIGLDGSAEVSRAAADALAAGEDSPALAELAAVSGHMNPFELDALIAHVATELALPDLPPAARDGRAAAAQCRRMLTGEISAAALADWTHGVFGHTSEHAIVNALARFSDDHSDAAYAGRPLDTVTARIRAAAELIVAGVRQEPPEWLDGR